MSHRQLAAHHRYEVIEISAMAHVRQQHAILVVDRLPIVPVKFRIVEIFALNAPLLTIDLLPLGTRINAHFKLRYVERAVANLYRRRTIGGHDPPTIGSNTLVEQ